MTDNEKHVCPICGSEYKYCDYCKKMLAAGITPWRAICDTLDCYTIFMAIKEIKAGRADLSVYEALKQSMKLMEINNKKIRDNIMDYLNESDVLNEDEKSLDTTLLDSEDESEPTVKPKTEINVEHKKRTKK